MSASNALLLDDMCMLVKLGDKRVTFVESDDVCTSVDSNDMLKLINLDYMLII